MAWRPFGLPFEHIDVMLTTARAVTFGAQSSAGADDWSSVLHTELTAAATSAFEYGVQGQSSKNAIAGMMRMLFVSSMSGPVVVAMMANRGHVASKTTDCTAQAAGFVKKRWFSAKESVADHRFVQMPIPACQAMIVVADTAMFVSWGGKTVFARGRPPIAADHMRMFESMMAAKMMAAGSCHSAHGAPRRHNSEHHWALMPARVVVGSLSLVGTKLWNAMWP
jgi:hypothetical protein